MRVIKLDAVFVGKITYVIAMVVCEISQHVLKTGRRQEILLPESKLLTVIGGRIRVQDHGDVFGFILGRNRVGIAACIEFFEIKLVGR